MDFGHGATRFWWLKVEHGLAQGWYGSRYGMARRKNGAMARALRR